MRLLLLFLLIFLSVPFATFSQPGTADLSFNPDDPGFGYNTRIAFEKLNGAVELSDGSLIFYGIISSYNGTAVGNVFKISADGVLDQTFSLDPELNDLEIIKVSADPDDNLYVYGSTDNFGEQPEFVRLESNGSIDPGFAQNYYNVQSYIDDIEATADGVFACGQLLDGFLSGIATGIIFFNQDGSIDESFSQETVFTKNGNAEHPVSIELDDFGNIYAVGSFDACNEIPVSRLVRILPDGTLDENFSTQYEFDFDLETTPFTTETLYDVELLQDGRIVVGGTFTAVNEQPSKGMAILEANGEPDQNFNLEIGFENLTEDMMRVLEIEITENDEILTYGNFTHFQGDPSFSFAAINPDGTPNLTFKPEYGGIIENGNLLILSSGEVLITGRMHYFDHQVHHGFVKLSAEGNIIQDFIKPRTFNWFVSDAVVDDEDRIIAVGSFTNYKGSLASMIVRLNENGSIDESFNSGIGGRGDSYESLSTIYSMNQVALDNEGRILVGGRFTSYNGVPIGGKMMRLHEDGSLDTTFSVGSGPEGFHAASEIAVSPNGQIYVGGNFDMWNGELSAGVVRLDEDGSRDESFDVGIGVDINSPASVTSIAFQENGKVLIAGRFFSYQQVEISHAARLNNDASLDETFNPPTSSISSRLYKIDVDSTGKIFIAGRLDTDNNSQFDISFMKLNADGSQDIDFEPLPATFSPRDFLLEPDGGFSILHGYDNVIISRFDDMGETDEYWPGGESFGDGGSMLLFDSDFNFIVTGGFDYYGETGRHRIAKIFSGISAGIAVSEKDEELVVYPNPLMDRLTIEVPADEHGGLVLVNDLNGKLMLSQKVQDDVVELNLINLNPGVYLVRYNHRVARVVVQ